MPGYVENQLLKYNGICTLTWHPRCPGSYTSGYRVHHPNAALTTSQGLRLGNYVSWYGVNHLSQALTTAREQRSLMYGVPSPHLMLEDDSRYPRWYSNDNIPAPQYLGVCNCTARDFDTRRCSLCTQYAELIGEIATSQGIEATC
jgi:hypothetical protein